MIINFHASNAFKIIAIIILLLFSSNASAAPAVGNRIWDESKGMPTTYTWNSHSFSGFYYNLDDNLGTEELTIRNIKRTIEKGNLDYKTSPVEVSFEYSGFGKYQVIGFMADKYFAGYTTRSEISNKEKISTLVSQQLHKVILDDEDKRVVTEGGTLTLKEGYVLKMKEVDISAGPGQVWVTLLKDGVEVDDDVISGRDAYVYSKKVGSTKDLPIIAVHFDSVFRGREVNAAFIRGLFQISESYTPVRSGDRYGELEIRSVDEGGIEMNNRNSISLSAGNTIDLVGDLKIVVADSSVLRFGLSVERTGTFEVRGTIYPVTDEWTPLNFGINIGGTNIGFYYDLDKDVGKEKLEIEKINGKAIPEGKLKYFTSAEEVSFDYSGFGKYAVIGFMADRYFAGYTKNSAVSNNRRISTLAGEQLHRVLLDDETKRVFSEGGTVTLKEGYVIKMKDIDIGAGPGQILIGLLKDGTEVDTDVVAGGEDYVYMKKVGNANDVPIIVVHFDSVFRGREVNAAFIRGIFQISESFTSLKIGDRYGEMELRTVDESKIEMMNENSVSLSSGSTVDLMGNIKFKVADSSELRFYPFVFVTPQMIANQLLIDAPVKATAGDEISIKVMAGGMAVEGAAVAINSEVGQTDSNGVFNYVLKKTMESGTYNVTATKLGYRKASKNIEIQGYIENRLSINAPSKSNQFGTIKILVTHNEQPVSGATVMYDNVTIGQTGDKGALNYTLEDSGTYTIYASKSGYTSAARDIEVRVPFAEFKALDINLPSDVVFTDQKVLVLSNVTNVGTKASTLPVALIINNTEVDSIPVTLAPGEVKPVTFRHEVTLPAGNYTIEVLGQKKSLQVRESKFNVLLALVIIIGIGAVVIYLLTAKGTVSIEAIRKKFQERKEIKKS